jgi:hypothetical protein
MWTRLHAQTEVGLQSGSRSLFEVHRMELTDNGISLLSQGSDVVRQLYERKAGHATTSGQLLHSGASASDEPTQARTTHTQVPGSGARIAGRLSASRSNQCVAVRLTGFDRVTFHELFKQTRSFATLTITLFSPFPGQSEARKSGRKIQVNLGKNAFFFCTKKNSSKLFDLFKKNRGLHFDAKQKQKKTHSSGVFCFF